jgi:hypothetical protein
LKNEVNTLGSNMRVGVADKKTPQVLSSASKQTRL